MTDGTDEPEIGDEVEVTFRGEVTNVRGVGGHRIAVIETEGVPGGDILAYIHDTIDDEYAENYTDHRAAEVRSVDTETDRSGGDDGGD